MKKTEDIIVPAKCNFFYIHPKMNDENELGDGDFYNGESILETKNEAVVEEEEEEKSEKGTSSNK